LVLTWIKTQISNLVHMMRFWNNRKLTKKTFGAGKPKA
jgi:hypothetical protein